MPAIRFGSDGWIATLGKSFTDEALRSLAEALSLALIEKSNGSTVYVGYDTRRDAARHAAVFAGCLKDAGLTVFLSDKPCPTPVIGWNVAQNDDACAGVMITASAHGQDKQGVVLRMGNGVRPSSTFVRRIEDLIPVHASLTPRTVPELDFTTPYIQHLIDFVDAEAIQSARLRFVVDALYGAEAGCLATILRKLGCEVHELHTPDNGDMHGLRPDPVEPWINECKQLVRTLGADAGFALDGDADRSGIIDELGQTLTPQRMAPLIMQHLVNHHHFTGRFVATVSTTALVRAMAEKLRHSVSIVPIGFRNIYDEMLEGDVVCGIEEYGGIGIPAHLMERDGILVSLLFAEMRAISHEPLSQLAAELEVSVGHMRYIRYDIRTDAGTMQSLRNILPGLNPPELCGMTPCEVSHIDGLYLKFEDGSWLLIHPSRVNPIVRIYGEAPTLERRDALVAAGCALCRAGGADVAMRSSSSALL